MQAAVGPALDFRERQVADDAFIAELAAQAFSEYSSRSVSTTLRMAREGVTWLAYRDDLRVGFGVVRPGDFGRAELCAIAVHEAARGLGIGAALLVKIERVMLLAGFSELGLHTARANVSALDLFSKRGFRIERHLPRFYRGVFDAYELRKRLEPAR